MSTNTETQTPSETAKRIHIFVNRRRLEIENVDVSGAQLLELAGFEGTHWDLLKLHREGDPTGGTVILANQELSLREGERFRVVPGNRTFGARR